MAGHSSLQGLTKNAPFLLVFGLDQTDGNPGVPSTTKVSTDGGTLNASTNSVTSISTGVYTLQLTADEMNGDYIIVQIRDTSAPSGVSTITLYTGTIETAPTDDGVTNFSSNFLDFVVTALNSENYLFHDIDLNSATYNYYGLAKTGNQWVIVREDKGTQALEYAVKTSGVNDKKFLQSWTSRVTLTYSGTSPF